MQTLLIDNHDSFTYNLFQYIAVCNGQAPLVVRNDEMPWADAARLSFDNIVISPGPGRPQRASDLGISAEALKHSKVPILGVCLGHQAIGHACGATVDLAVRPMHGRLDRISHSQRDIFRGIPDRFEAVRYHSLAVTRLPPSLAALAWAADGTLMALKHLAKPWWGVQFHPESICTEYGARLLRNFHDLTQEWRNAPPHQDTFGSFLPRSDLQRSVLEHMHVECASTQLDAEELFAQVFSESTSAFWLDSSLADSSRARFSFLGDASGPRSELVTYSASQHELVVQRSGQRETSSQHVFDYLRRRLEARRPVGPDLPFDFTGGFVGYFGYETAADVASERSSPVVPDAAWIRADRFVAFDHAEGVVWIVCIDNDVICADNRAWMEMLREHLSGRPGSKNPGTVDAAAPLGPLAWRTSLMSYRNLILQAQQLIREGETYEVCLTNKLAAKGAIRALDVYRVLRSHNPAPYSAYLRFGDVGVLCASPELFLRISEDRTVDSRPIKGTSPRGKTPEEDDALAVALAKDEKSRAENLMIVDLLRNDLNRVCELGSVHVPQLFQVESFATVHQLVSTIRGRLRTDRSAIDCVQAAFPGGSMTGAPKERTIRILQALETEARGIYSGSAGYLSSSGTMQLNIVIRTVVSTPDGISIGAGGAIIALSDPDAEIEEIVLKTRALVDVLRTCGASSDGVATDTTSAGAAQGPLDG